MNFWPRYVGDIQRKTGHLSCAEMGAYDRLLDHIYATEQPLPGDLDACCRIARAMDRGERKAVESVLEQFFSRVDGVYTNDRACYEIRKARPKMEAARANGAKGGRPSGTQQKPSGLADGLPAGTQDEPISKAPQTQTQSSSSLRSEEHPKPRRRGRGSVELPEFERFWQAYPRKIAKQAAAKAFAQARPDAELLNTILAAVADQARSEQWLKEGGRYVPHAATWLNGRRWEDQATELTAASTGSMFDGAR